MPLSFFKKGHLMCNDTFNPRLAPLVQDHLDAVTDQFPKQVDFAQEIYAALRNHLTPQTNLLVAFVALKELYDQGKAGIFAKFGRVLYAPLSIVAKTGNHEWTRFRPAAVEELHTSFLSFMMAKPNRLAVEQVFGRYGMTLSQGHCCGIIVGAIDAVATLEASPLFAARNEMRSYAEAMGMPVVVTDFANIPVVNSDLGAIEQEFYDLYETMFTNMPLLGRDSHVDPSQAARWEEIVRARPLMTTSQQLAA